MLVAVVLSKQGAVPVVMLALRGGLRGHARTLDVHASQQGPLAWHHTYRENLLEGSLLLPLFGSSVLKPHLGRRGQFGDAGQLLSVVDVRILVLSKGYFQLFQLLVAESGAMASPGRGGVGTAPPAETTSSHGGLTQ
ncbi:hypothetical protein INR49_012388 [Caranx melampygus]|nr:hypothetical protein INR49_012388 [Caranx melampygus]